MITSSAGNRTSQRRAGGAEAAFGVGNCAQFRDRSRPISAVSELRANCCGGALRWLDLHGNLRARTCGGPTDRSMQGKNLKKTPGRQLCCVGRCRRRANAAPNVGLLIREIGGMPTYLVSGTYTLRLGSALPIGEAKRTNFARRVCWQSLRHLRRTSATTCEQRESS